MKPWKHKCDLQLLVCEPNPLRPDRVTVGFVLRDLNPESPRVEVRIAKNLQAVRCIYPDADIEAIEGTLLDLKPLLENVTDIEKHLQNLPSDLPFELALLAKGAVLTESMETEAYRFEDQYLKRIERPAARIEGMKRDPASDGDEPENSPEAGTVNRAPYNRTADYGRTYLLRKAQEAFSQFGLLDVVHTDISVERYTFKGDTLKIDFGYRHLHQPRYRMFQATSLVMNLHKVKELGYSWRDMRPGMQEHLAAECEMLAIVESEQLQKSQAANDARRFMEDNGIRVEPVTSMLALAAQAKQDLQI